MIDIKETDKVIPRVLSWCLENRHSKCRKDYRRFLISDKNKIVWLDEVVVCACKKRGCPCYTKPADRPAAVKKTTRRKK